MKNSTRYLVALLITAFLPLVGIAQNNTEPDESSSTSLEFEDTAPPVRPVSGTFEHTRVINGHSTEMLGKHTMDVLFRHRFGNISDGAYELFGLDQAWVRLAVEYGITDKLMVGLGRSGQPGKSFDLYGKYAIFQQTTAGTGSIPVSVAWVSSMVLPF